MSSDERLGRLQPPIEAPTISCTYRAIGLNGWWALNMV
jgi:hypothetical protein